MEIGKGLANNRSLTFLNLEVSFTFISCLCKILTLVFQSNTFADIGLKELGKVLESNPVLRTLNIRVCGGISVDFLISYLFLG